MFYLNKSKGFTVLELLVVLAIIGVLLGVLLIAINPKELLAKSRDSQRLQDMDSMHKAINLALADNEITLIDTSSSENTISILGTQVLTGQGWIKYVIPAGKTGLAKYIPSLPMDPINNDTFYYAFASDGTTFELNAVMESPSNVTFMTTDGGNNPKFFEAGTNLLLIK